MSKIIHSINGKVNSISMDKNLSMEITATYFDYSIMENRESTYSYIIEGEKELLERMKNDYFSLGEKFSANMIVSDIRNGKFIVSESDMEGKISKNPPEDIRLGFSGGEIEIIGEISESLTVREGKKEIDVMNFSISPFPDNKDVVFEIEGYAKRGNFSKMEEIFKKGSFLNVVAKLKDIENGLKLTDSYSDMQIRYLGIKPVTIPEIFYEEKRLDLNDPESDFNY